MKIRLRIRILRRLFHLRLLGLFILELWLFLLIQLGLRLISSFVHHCSFLGVPSDLLIS
jgi:hypothetical protein